MHSAGGQIFVLLVLPAWLCAGATLGSACLLALLGRAPEYRQTVLSAVVRGFLLGVALAAVSAPFVETPAGSNVVGRFVGLIGLLAPACAGWVSALAVSRYLDRRGRRPGTPPD